MTTREGATLWVLIYSSKERTGMFAEEAMEEKK